MKKKVIIFLKSFYRLKNSSIFAIEFKIRILTGCSVARLSRLLWEQEAAGSNPATPTKKSCKFNFAGFFLVFIYFTIEVFYVFY